MNGLSVQLHLTSDKKKFKWTHMHQGRSIADDARAKQACIKHFSTTAERHKPLQISNKVQPLDSVTQPDRCCMVASIGRYHTKSYLCVTSKWLCLTVRPPPVSVILQKTNTHHLISIIAHAPLFNVQAVFAYVTIYWFSPSIFHFLFYLGIMPSLCLQFRGRERCHAQK